MSEKNEITLNDKPIDEKEFKKIKEEVKNNPKKKLKEVGNKKYRLLEKMQG